MNRKNLANRISRLARNRKMIIFGASKNFREFFSQNELLVDKIYKVIDNNASSFPNGVEIAGRSYEVEYPNKLINMDVRECFFVVTPIAYEAIIFQLREMFAHRKIEIIVLNEHVSRLELAFMNRITRKGLRNFIVVNGKGDTCENTIALLKYLDSEECLRNKYTIIWIGKSLLKLGKAVCLSSEGRVSGEKRFQRYKYLYYVGRAKYLLFDNKYISKLRTDQISIYLNHGPLPLKCTKNLIRLPKEINLAISPSTYSADIMSEQYSFPRSKFGISGSPRTDILYCEEKHEYVKELFGVTAEKKILWTPTLRELVDSKRRDSRCQYNLGIPIVSSEEDALELDCFLEDIKAQIIIKPHTYQDLSYMKLQDKKNIFIVTQADLEANGLNVYDIMNEMDACITDYSSIAFDFMLLNKPIIYTIDDMDMYTVGFSVKNPFELMPGEKARGMKDFKMCLKNAVSGVDIFCKERTEVNAKVNTFQDGENSKRVCNLIGL